MPARSLRNTPFLRLALLGDAAASGATGLLLAVGPIAPTGFDVAFVLAQALVVLGFAIAQWSAPGRSSAGVAPVLA